MPPPSPPTYEALAKDLFKNTLEYRILYVSINLI
jgi:hypothetical protein